MSSHKYYVSRKYPIYQSQLKELPTFLHNLNPHKATGPDDIPTYLLKELSYEIAPILMKIFQSSLHQGVLPAEWKSANVIPIFKKGDCSKTCRNY